jgi:PAS domain-containing protein
MDYKLFFEKMPVPAVVADNSCSIIFANEAWEKMMGWTEEELMGHRFLEFMHPDDRESTQESMQSVTEGCEPIFFRSRFRCKKISSRNAQSMLPGGYVELEWDVAKPADNMKIITARITHAQGSPLVKRKNVGAKQKL